MRMEGGKRGREQIVARNERMRGGEEDEEGVKSP